MVESGDEEAAKTRGSDGNSSMSFGGQHRAKTFEAARPRRYYRSLPSAVLCSWLSAVGMEHEKTTDKGPRRRVLNMVGRVPKRRVTHEPTECLLLDLAMVSRPGVMC